MDTTTENQLFQLCQSMASKLDEIHGDFREFKGATTTKVEALEKAQDSQAFWSKVQTICVIPVIAVFHQIAAHFGWIK